MTSVSCELSVDICQLRVDICQLSVANCELSVDICQLQVDIRQLRAASWKLIIVLLEVPSQSKVNGLLCFSFRVNHFQVTLDTIYTFTE